MKTTSSQMHNRVHLWIGGNMLPMTSPNDPVFFLHHAFVDKIWADWQAFQMKDNPDAAPHYSPLKDGPSGHNCADRLQPFKYAVREVMDINQLGYSYEVAPTTADAFAAVSLIKPKVRSAFGAD